MKKIICALCVCLLVAILPVSVWAEDILLEETHTTDETQVLEETLPEEVVDMMATATPEQIEQIKQYILYGVGELSKYEGTDGLTAFVLDYLNEIAWIMAGICFIVFSVMFKAKGKRWEDTATTMNNNACDMVEQSRAYIAEANQAAEERVSAMLKQASELLNLAMKELAEVKRRETACTEALTLMATEINALLQVANLSEIKRDELQTIFDKALASVEEAKQHDE